MGERRSIISLSFQLAERGSGKKKTARGLTGLKHIQLRVQFVLWFVATIYSLIT